MILSLLASVALSEKNEKNTAKKKRAGGTKEGEQ